MKSTHWLGEGAGGSGHMASVGLAGPEIISHRPVQFRDRPCVEVVYTYGIDRESEFGGEAYRYKKKAVLSRSGEVLDSETLEEKVYDLLTGEERRGFFGIDSPDIPGGGRESHRRLLGCRQVAAATPSARALGERQPRHLEDWEH